MITVPAFFLAAVLASPQDPPAQAPAPRDLKATELPASTGEGQADVEAGLRAFKRHRFLEAEVQFRKAMEADPQSAAAAFYLGYTYYKMAEPKRPFHPDKQKAAALFAKAYELDPQFRPVWGEPKAPKPKSEARIDK